MYLHVLDLSAPAASTREISSGVNEWAPSYGPILVEVVTPPMQEYNATPDSVTAGRGPLLAVEVGDRRTASLDPASSTASAIC